MAIVGDKLVQMKKDLASVADVETEEAQSQVVLLEQRIKDEEERRVQWSLENQRRRHNYVPLIFELLKQLAQKDKLDALFSAAQERKKASSEKEKAK